jgi:hypothetical protein
MYIIIGITIVVFVLLWWLKRRVGHEMRMSNSWINQNIYTSGKERE